MDFQTLVKEKFNDDEDLALKTLGYEAFYECCLHSGVTDNEIKEINKSLTKEQQAKVLDGFHEAARNNPRRLLLEYEFAVQHKNYHIKYEKIKKHEKYPGVIWIFVFLLLFIMSLSVFLLARFPEICPINPALHLSEITMEIISGASAFFSGVCFMVFLSEINCYKNYGNLRRSLMTSEKMLVEDIELLKKYYEENKTLTGFTPRPLGDDKILEKHLLQLTEKYTKL